MTAPLYAARGDLYAFGLPRGAVPNPGRLLADVSVSAGTLILGEHGLAEDDPFSVRASAGGTLPAPLVAGVTYYAAPTSADAWKPRATAGGSAIPITTTGTPERVVLVVALPVENWIRWASRLIDEMLPAHVVPLVKVDAAGVRADESGYDSTTGGYPEIIVMTCAELAAGKGLGLGGASSKSLTSMVDDAKKRLDRWASGIPVRGAPAQTPANLAVAASVPYRDPRGWNRFGGIC